MLQKEWAFLNANLQRKGICIGVQELYIAATAKARGIRSSHTQHKRLSTAQYSPHQPLGVRKTVLRLEQNSNFFTGP